MNDQTAKTKDDRPATANEMRLMVGAPPSRDRQGTIENFLDAPYNRWSLRHLSEIVPTRSVRPSDAAAFLDERPIDLSGVEVGLPDGSTVAVGSWLESSYTDGFVVLHGGNVIYERYFNDQTPSTPHLMFSVTKSFTGTMALMLIEQGRIAETLTVGDYVPELLDSAFGDATIRHMLDMTNSIEYVEDYSDPDAHIAGFANAFMPGGEGLYSNLRTLTGQHDRFSHGEAFHYVTPDPEVLGWVIRRVTGKLLAGSLHDMIWAPMGAEHQCCYWLDPRGVEMAGGGLAVSLRDAARFGQMILQDGHYNDRQVVSVDVARRIKSKRNAGIFTRFYADDLSGMEAFDSYHDQWWGLAGVNAVTGIGIHGQFVYVNSDSGVVIARHASEPEAEGAHQTEAVFVMHAIARVLSDREG